MIRINLLGEKVDHTLSYVLQTLGLVALLGVTIIGCVIVEVNLQSDVELKTSQQAQLKQKLTKLEKVTREIDDLELKKKVLREKLMTIATLKAKKRGPVHILDDINLALPERAWLTSVKEKSGVIELNGVALDEQTIAGFMNNLEKGQLFGMVDLVLATEYIQDEIKLKQFSVSVTLKDPLKRGGGEQKKDVDEKAPAKKS